MSRIDWDATICWWRNVVRSLNLVGLNGSAPGRSVPTLKKKLSALFTALAYRYNRL